MPTIGVADVLVRPSFKGLQESVGRELDGVGEKAGDKAGKGFGGKFTGAVTGFFGGALKAAGISGGLTVGAAFGTALYKGFGRLQAIENAKAKLTGLGHDVESVTAIMENAMASVKGTAFGMDEAATVAAGAVAAGVKPGKELERTLKLTGDAATIAGVGMGEMGAIFNKVASSNKIQGDVIAQLNDAGIPIIQLLGKELGKSAEETVKLASEGKINFETFQKAMESGLGGAALKSGETLQGAFKNTMAAVSRIGANLLSGVYPKIRDFFAGAIEWMKPLEEGAKVAGARVGEFVDQAMVGAQGLYDLIVKGDYTGKLEAAFGWAEDSPFVDFILRARDGVMAAKDSIDQLLAGLSMNKDVRDQFTGQLDGWVQAGANIRTAFDNVASFIRSDLVPQLQSMGQWVKDNKDWLESLAIGVGGAVAAFKIYTTTLALHALATGGLAAVQTAMAWTAIAASIAFYRLNDAMRANLIGIIVFAVIGLVTALVWFFTQTEMGRDIVKNVWGFIQSVIGGVADWFTNTVVPGWNAAISAIGGFFSSLWTDWIKPVFDWISGAAGAVGDAFGALSDGAGQASSGVSSAFDWLYKTVIKPVFDGIAAAVKVVGDGFRAFYEAAIKPAFDSASVIIGGFLLFFRGVGQLIASVITYVLAPIFMVFWNQMIATWTGIGNTIADWWNFAVGIFNGAVGFIRDVFAAAFTWLHDVVIVPVFNAIGSAMQWVWDFIVKPLFDSWVNMLTVVLPSALNWLYVNAVQPVFNAIGSAVNWVWSNMIKPVFDTLANWFTVVLPNAANWMYSNGIKPVFDAVGSTIKWTWETIIRPVFDALSNFITKTIPDAFNAGVGFIKTAWDKLIDVAKMPVRFVIDTVINDGLIGAFNTVAGILPGIDKLPKVALPKGFARGGVLPGQSSWRNGDDQLVPMRKGEGVYVSEVMQDPYERARLYAMNKAAIMGRKASEARALFGEGLAKGGIVSPLKQLLQTQGYNRVHKGVDFAAGVGTPVFATEAGRVSWSGPGVQAPGVWGGNEIHVDGQSGIQEWFAHLSSMAVKVGDMVRAGQQIGLSGNTGISSGPHLHFGTFAGGWPNDIDPYGYLSGAGIPSGGPFNPIEGIIDGLLSKFREAFPAAGMIADLAIGVGKKIIGDVSNLITGGGKGSAAGDPKLYDLGGVLPPGISQVVNRTGKPEAILNPQQWADVHRIATQSGGFDTDALDRLTEAVKSARQIIIPNMSSDRARAVALARAMEGA